MRIAIAILALIMLPLVIAYSLSPLLPRHLDPRNVREERSPLASIESLAMASRLIGGGDIREAKQILGNLSEAPLPPDIRSLYVRIVEVVNATSDYLNTSRSLIDEASILIGKGDYDTAEKMLNESLSNLSRVDTILVGLQDLISRINIPGLSQRALEIVGSINSTVNSLKNRSRELLAEISRRASLIETNISIEVTPRSAWYGDPIAIRGVLVDRSGSPFANRSVVIHVGSINTTVVTDRLGRFESIQRLVYYNRSIDIYAEYIPRGLDISKYAYSKSRIVNISVAYITPIILASLNTTIAKPGDTVLLSIWLSHEVAVNISTSFKNVTLPRGSGFHVYLEIPSNISEGIYRVNISTLPEGIIGPVNWSTSIKIYRLDNSVRIDYPSYMITGVAYTLKVYSEAPSEILVTPADPGIRFSVKENEIYVYVPYTFLGSSVDLVVSLVPRDPGYRVSVQVIRIGVYNTLVIGLTGVLVISAIVLAGVRRDAKEIRRIPGEETIPQGGSVGGKIVMEADQGAVSSIRAAERLIEIVSGVPLKRSYTYREYASMVSERLSSALGSLVSRFFLLLERHLYGGPRYRGLLREIVSIAEEILRIIGRAVRHD